MQDPTPQLDRIEAKLDNHLERIAKVETELNGIIKRQDGIVKLGLSAFVGLVSVVFVTIWKKLGL